MSLKISLKLILSILFIASLCFTQANATVMYKKVDKDGKVTYTDKPDDDAETLLIDTDSNSSPALPDQSDQSQEYSYDIFSIDSPVNNSSLRSENGVLNIVINVSPQIQSNHSIRLHIDGNKTGQDQKVPYFTLTNIESDTYEMLAIIVDDETQEVIKTSQPVTFHFTKG